VDIGEDDTRRKNKFNGNENESSNDISVLSVVFVTFAKKKE
jgi:hypothetical protein